MPVGGAHRFVQLVASDFSFCGLGRDGSLWCWGWAQEPPLDASLADAEPCRWTASGQVVETACARQPVRIASATPYSALSAHTSGGCGLTDAGGLECWGYDPALFGESEPLRQTPAAATLPVALGQVSSGSLFAMATCGVATDGGLWCWGSGYALGVPGPQQDRPPARLESVSSIRFRDVSVGAGHACAVAEAGDVWCWGANPRDPFDQDRPIGLGILGNGSTADATEPVKVLGGLRFRSVSAGENATCGIAGDGAYCWGLNDKGQLGDGTTDHRPFPTRVRGQD